MKFTPRRSLWTQNALTASQINKSGPGGHPAHDSTDAEEQSAVRSKPRISWQAWASAIFTASLLILTSVYASGGTVPLHSRFLYSSSSNAIFVLSVLSGFTGVFLSATIAITFEKVQWLLISRQEGLRLSKYLSLQPGTGITGLLTLVIGKGLRIGSSTRAWASVRLGAIVLGPVLRILILSNVNTQEVFDFLEDSPTSLGWGMSLFNDSLAKNVSLVADQVTQADLAMFLSTPYRAVDLTTPEQRSVPCGHIPGRTNEQNCKRVYYMPGGMDLVATHEKKAATKTGIILAQDQQGYILDFTEGPGVGEEWSFDAESECKVYGFPFGAFHLCLKNGAPNELHARIVPCPESVSSLTACMKNVTWPRAPGWTTSLTTSFRNGTVAYSLSNGTILAQTFTSDLVPAPVSATAMLTGYRSAFSHFDSVAAVLTAFADPETANMFPLYVYPAMVWANLKSISGLSAQNPAMATRAQDTLQCLLAIMLFYCHPSLFSSSLSIYLNATSEADQREAGEKDVVKLKEFAQDLVQIAPPDTKVGHAMRRYRLLVGKDTLIAYIVLSGAALLACFVTLGWVEWLVKRQIVPLASYGSFPAWDERIQCEIQGGIDTDDDGRGWSSSQVNQGRFVELVENMRIVLADHGKEG